MRMWRGHGWCANVLDPPVTRRWIPGTMNPVTNRRRRGRCAYDGDAVVLIVLSLLPLGCTRPNPAFSVGGAVSVASESASGSGETSAATAADVTAEGTESASSGVESTSGSAESSEEESASETTSSDATKRVFVTSRHFTPAELGGLQGADAKCQALALEAKVEGTYKAWLSDAVHGPADRMTKGGPYVRMDNLLVASDWDGLVSGTLENPLLITEKGEEKGEFRPVVCAGREVWTNTGVDGTPRTEEDCGGWTSLDGMSFVGYAYATDAFWTSSDCLQVGCSMALPLYCVEQ
jgi:hypothetical protein